MNYIERLTHQITQLSASEREHLFMLLATEELNTLHKTANYRHLSQKKFLEQFARKHAHQYTQSSGVFTVTTAV